MHSPSICPWCVLVSQKAPCGPPKRLHSTCFVNKSITTMLCFHLLWPTQGKLGSGARRHVGQRCSKLCRPQQLAAGAADVHRQQVYRHVYGRWHLCLRSDLPQQHHGRHRHSCLQPGRAQQWWQWHRWAIRCGGRVRIQAQAPQLHGFHHPPLILGAVSGIRVQCRGGVQGGEGQGGSGAASLASHHHIAQLHRHVQQCLQQRRPQRVHPPRRTALRCRSCRTLRLLLEGRLHLSHQGGGLQLISRGRGILHLQHHFHII
mmetsp:Transcript_15502/g.46818  ORF Transcript_15502/g.46818 Transcript_15502/m.46818 type:complete len:260 (-) Transcript_15502:620-1399(-)